MEQTQQTHILLDSKTKKELKEVARKMGLSLSAFLRMSAYKEAQKLNCEFTTAYDLEQQEKEKKS